MVGTSALAAQLEQLVARATATPASPDDRDPLQAATALREVERAGREAARELRALVDELRPGPRQPCSPAAARADEREQLARHVHDLVGHGLSLLVLHATVGAVRVERGIEPASAVLRRVEAIAADTQLELRQLLAALNGDGEDDERGERTVAQLVGTARRHGQLVHVDGGRAPLPADVERVVAAVVREGLTNARKHAGLAPVVVRISHGTASVGIELANAAGEPLGEPGSRLGLRMLREHVAARGGRLASGPTAGGGWRLAAELPHG